ncbi:HTTM domain-containing protein [Christiangramia flava]|uniref:Vitamin K-dependent gamma-carboxylase n=1 Tax=Christiangramia flava JLT2011 TaxID=1229726 RepID=A0A1L7I2C2_9FLAO|nr:HTTM domain-containing protein [Christiangramia flava]APU67222.1 Vitamin K-dependent gamma-carboxylase [Christiangramia flava JLT2011]OSS39807.1 Vitamin K-dependent gamma-carboxylase [Christiangramia flava JLT2011]
MNSKISKYLNSYTEAAPLAVFRLLFGIMMFVSILRFWLNGWIEKLYLLPKFHFSYYGFAWVKPLGNFTYVIFAICGLAALLVAAGFKYRLAIITFFLSFTYIELMDKTTYLNHYYFISVLSFLMIFLPAGNYFSVDAWRNARSRFQKIPRWCVDAIKLMLGIVYFYAGLAKLNSDWLFRAMPLKIWLPSKYDLPFLGDLMQQEWVHYAFSWSGMLYDLFIPFLLLWKRTRILAFAMVVIFHVLTRVLFPIGMFPYIMIVSALIFFSPQFHHRLLQWFSNVFGIKKPIFDTGRLYFPKPQKRKIFRGIVAVFFMIQLLFPWRYLLYPGELFWTEEGFRFSWRVMLMEKAGYAQFKIVDGKTGKRFYVDNSDFLTPFQEKQMSFQPDFILEYAHYLARHFAKDGHQNIEVYVENYVALNGRKSAPYISPDVNLLNFADSFEHKTFILPFNDEIKGL